MYKSVYVQNLKCRKLYVASLETPSITYKSNKQLLSDHICKKYLQQDDTNKLDDSTKRYINALQPINEKKIIRCFLPLTMI